MKHGQREKIGTKSPKIEMPELRNLQNFDLFKIQVSFG